MKLLQAIGEVGRFGVIEILPERLISRGFQSERPAKLTGACQEQRAISLFAKQGSSSHCSSHRSESVSATRGAKWLTGSVILTSA